MRGYRAIRIDLSPHTRIPRAAARPAVFAAAPPGGEAKDAGRWGAATREGPFDEATGGRRPPGKFSCGRPRGEVKTGGGDGGA